MKQCRICGGTYEPVLRDGTAYYHACPPLPSDADATLAVPRPHARNENVHVTPDGTVGPIADGDGAVDV
jgi:hypothetical protein